MTEKDKLILNGDPDLKCVGLLVHKNIIEKLNKLAKKHNINLDKYLTEKFNANVQEHKLLGFPIIYSDRINMNDVKIELGGKI